MNWTANIFQWKRVGEPDLGVAPSRKKAKKLLKLKKKLKIIDIEEKKMKIWLSNCDDNAEDDDFADGFLPD